MSGSRIRQLPAEIVTKIAAGEVIERPASVVKELLENSIDAGSTRIDVDVEQGGTELIRVVDNGSGIAAADLPLVFASHATSKLSSSDDLFRISTLGFRGEALASIGAVAQVTVQSRPADQPCGAEISCQGGQLSAVRAWNGSSGTRMEVRHLFYNTPVRRKFMRTISTEMGHITEHFIRIALAHPMVHMVLRHNGKLIHEVPGGADVGPAVGLLDRIGTFFGVEVRDQVYLVEAEQKPAAIRGYIADPACDRGNARLQYLFVNGRCIRDRSLGHAIQEGYRGLLMTGRYAVAFLFIELPPDQVDVNVHPTKAEVRFREAQSIYHLVFANIRNRMRAENLTGKLQTPRSPAGQTSNQAMPSSVPRTDAVPWTLFAPIRPTPFLPFTASARTTEGPQVSDVRRAAARAGDEAGDTQNDEESECSEPLMEGAGVAPVCHASTSLPTYPVNAIQVHDAYLVVETNEGMLVIDQHALHERILFEHLKERIRAGALEKQRLLVPETVELTADQAACVLEHQQDLAELGLDVEDFGGGTVLVTACPAMLNRQAPQDILRAVVDHLVTKDRLPNREQLLNDLLSVMACRAAVKAGDRLTSEEIASLVAQRNLAADAHHCPHGRPTSLLFSRQELDRQFGRM